MLTFDLSSAACYQWIVVVLCKGSNVDITLVRPVRIICVERSMLDF